MPECESEVLIARWLEWLELNQGRSPRTAEKYGRYLRRLDKWLAEQDIELLAATEELLEDYTGITAHRAGLKPRSRQAMVSAIKGFYRWAERARLVSASPAARVPYPKAGSRLPRSMGLDVAETLLMAPGLDTFLGVRDTAIISLLLCGIRVSGLVGMNESDLLWIQEDGREELVLRVREKGDKERLVPTHRHAWALMRAYLGHETLEEVDRSIPSGDQVLFVSTSNRTVRPHEYNGEARRLSRHGVFEMIQTRGKRADLPADQLHPHALRHLFGTELAEEDTSTLAIQALMGHADPKTTSIYARLAMRTLHRIVREASPLAKIKTPVSDLVRALERRSV